MTTEEKGFAFWLKEVAKVATVGAGIIAAWWLAQKQKKGGLFWTIFGGR